MFQQFISSHNEHPSPTHQQTELHWLYALKMFDLGSNIRLWICFACWFFLISSITSMAPLIHILRCQAPWFDVVNSWNLHFSHHSKGWRERGSGPRLHGAPGPDGVLLPPDPFTVSSYPQGFPVLHQGHHHRQADGEGERVSGSNCWNAFTNSIINLHSFNLDVCAFAWVCVCCSVFLSRFPNGLFKSTSCTWIYVLFYSNPEEQWNLPKYFLGFWTSCSSAFLMIQSLLSPAVRSFVALFDAHKPGMRAGAVWYRNLFLWNIISAFPDFFSVWRHIFTECIQTTE